MRARRIRLTQPIGIRGRPHDESGKHRRHLIDRHIDGGAFATIVERRQTLIGNHADDGPGNLFGGARPRRLHQEMLPDGIDVWEVQPRHRLVDDRDVRLAEPVGIEQGAALAHAQRHRTKGTPDSPP